ncbi:NUDIX hydrolase domain-like protein [Tuber brumale]|nr:NUDIX hydrolase domain-like protein [Tuber brumale]
MSPLSPTSIKALERLRAYVPPPTIYSSLSMRRRAAVLLLLFADRGGDLRIVLTVRSASLRTFAGQVALPGGRADHPDETSVQTARREAYEEVGLPLDSHPFPSQFSVEHLTELPTFQAGTNIGVRPCVAYMRDITKGQTADVDDSLMPKLDPHEVASVFTVPLERFLMNGYDGDGAMQGLDGIPWYSGNWFSWGGRKWKNHEFQAPVWNGAKLLRYKVWGMTARVLVDAARIAYGRDPDFASPKSIGDEDFIASSFAAEEMDEGVRSGGSGKGRENL